MELLRFAEFISFDKALNFLGTRLALNEPWDYSDSEKEFNHGNLAAQYYMPILANYLEHTFRKIRAEDKIVYSPDNSYACFNTGLVTPNLEEIFVLSERNSFHGSLIPFFFKRFIKKSDPEFLHLFSTTQPRTPNYFGNPDMLIFNPGLEIIPDIDHIIRDNRYRFPDELQKRSDRDIKQRLSGAITDISMRVKINYKLAIPQFFNNSFQLLLPLYLIDDNKPDLALVVEKVNDHVYSAKTCLTMGMAYNNARLIVCPLSDWLKP